MSNEQIYLYRRKGLSDYATCDRARYVELSQHKLFETMICYASAEPEEGDRDGRQLEWERAENKRLREGLKAARNDLLAVIHLVPGDYIQKSVASAEAAIASAEPKWWEPSENSADYKGPFRTCPAGEVVTEIEWEVFHANGLFIRDSGSAEPNNQCDGCRAGIPLINGMHRMGKPGEYPDLMACTSKRYDYDPDEPANKESAQ